VSRLAAIALALLALAGTPAASADGWSALPPAPEPRTEVAAAPVGGRIAVVGGIRADGGSSARVDVYDPGTRGWSRFADLPQGVNHAMAAGDGDLLYVVGGYTAAGPSSRRAFVLARDRRWRELPPLPEPRAAGGAAVVAGKLYVVGGVRRGSGDLGARSFVYEPDLARWRPFAGPPTRREHLGVAALGGRIYALGGRTGGLDTNLRAAEAYDPARGRWYRLPPMPTARGGTAAAATTSLVVSVGGEGPGGTYPQAEAYDPARRRWRSLPPSPQPRHGLGVVGIGRRVYALLGGPTPGLSASDAALTIVVR
jgi:N-acetylneuraminic acid mutarotase